MANFKNFFTKEKRVKQVKKINNPFLTNKYKSLYNRYKRGAERRGYSFELSEDKFLDVVTSNCFYCGAEPFQNHQGILYMGIDRRNNEKGYNDYNVTPCCKHCNKAKSTLGYVEFDNWVEQITEHQTKMKKVYDDMLIDPMMLLESRYKKFKRLNGQEVE